MMIECKTCKKKISKNAKVCPNCGEITEYAIKNRKKMTENIIIIIIAVVALGIGFMLAMRTISIRGSWKKTENYDKLKNPHVTNLRIKGKQTIIYKFKDNNKCKRTIIIDGDEISEQHEVNGVIRGINYTRPFHNEVDYNCTYELDGDKIYLKFEDLEDEELYIRIEKNNLYIDGEKYIRMN